MSSHAEIGEKGPDSDGITTEVLHGIAQAREVERLQLEVWGGDEVGVVPSHAVLIVSDYGGILLGAKHDGALVGFAFGFLARSEGTLFHASHMLGVLPAYQHKGIGATLKWRQREVALGQGLDLMRWTFDPLEARNAYFNFHKLGTVCRLYRPDYYGPMEDALNRNLPTDRLVVEWHLRDAGRGHDFPAERQTILQNREGRPELRIDDIVPGRPIAIEIPRDVQTIKREAPDTALSWRLAVRQAFSVAFDSGYEACDFRDGEYVLLPP
jgi:predicted GNAT superfamily acetyltransferase